MGIISNLYVTATHCRRFARITSIFFLLHFFHTLQALMLSLADYKLNISVTLIN